MDLSGFWESVGKFNVKLNLFVMSNEKQERRETKDSLKIMPSRSEEIDYYADDEDDIYRLPYFQASLFASIFEDTLTEINILFECNNEMRLTKVEADMNLLLSRKFGVEEPKVKDELDGIDVKKLGCFEYKLNKLDADRNYFNNAISQSYVHLALDNSYKTLHDYVQDAVDNENYQIFIREDHAKHKHEYRELIKQLRGQRNHIKSVIYDANSLIDDLRSKVEDAALWTEIQSRYVNYWQSARAEQHLQRIKDIESVSAVAIEYYKRRFDQEQTVHSEVEYHTTIMINETLQRVEDMMNKYDKDMEEIDLKIQKKRLEYQKKLELRQELEATIEKHDKQIKDWIQFKDQREKERQYRNKMNKSACQVQAWWRGLLVRRQLGPFRPKRGKGAKPKKK